MKKIQFGNIAWLGHGESWLIHLGWSKKASPKGLVWPEWTWSDDQQNICEKALEVGRAVSATTWDQKDLSFYRKERQCLKILCQRETETRQRDRQGQFTKESGRNGWICVGVWLLCGFLLLPSTWRVSVKVAAQVWELGAFSRKYNLMLMHTVLLEQSYSISGSRL